MTRASEVVNFFVRLAANGQGVDKDRAYGFQCADVPTYAAYEYFGVHLWGNAIDLLHAAAGVGWEVVRTSSGQLPRVGAFFVKSYVGRDGIDYGHTGIIVEVLDRQTVRTVEQNLAGNLEHGSPAEYNTRKLSELIGWFYPPYEKEETHNSNTNTTTQLMEDDNMFTISAPGRGIALMTGGRFYALLDPKDPAVFWEKGVPHMQVSQKSFDNFQNKNNVDRLDDDTVKKLIAGLKK